MCIGDEAERDKREEMNKESQKKKMESGKDANILANMYPFYSDSCSDAWMATYTWKDKWHDMCRVNKVTSEETIFVLQIRDKNTASDEGMGRGRVRRKERRRCRGLKLPPAEWRLGQEEAGGSRRSVCRLQLFHSDNLSLFPDTCRLTRAGLIQSRNSQKWNMKHLIWWFNALLQLEERHHSTLTLWHLNRFS